MQLFCLPHAGAGASAYRHWPQLLPPTVDLVPIQLPGREARFAEPPARTAAEVVDGVLEPLLDRISGPFALFGHSMGALLSYELAHALADRGRPPAHLFVSGYAAPQRIRPTGGIVHLLPDDELLEHLEYLEGTPPEVLASPELLRLLLPVCRNDFGLCETHVFRPRPPLRIPVTALAGVADRGAPPAEVEAWRELTTGDFVHRSFPGGHFYLLEQAADVVAAVVERLPLGGSARPDRSDE